MQLRATSQRMPWGALLGLAGGAALGYTRAAGAVSQPCIASTSGSPKSSGASRLGSSDATQLGSGGPYPTGLAHP